MTNEELIEALEKVTGPDACLDTQIGLHVGNANGWPLYTSSLDAALTLVPEGCFWLASYGRTRVDEPMGGVMVFRGDMLGADSKPIGEAEAETVPLALCIAALRARQVPA